MTQSNHLTFEEAALTVLQRLRRPLTIREILERITEDSLFQPAGATPEKSLYAIIVRANRRSEQAGSPQRFVVHKGADGVRYSAKTR